MLETLKKSLLIKDKNSVVILFCEIILVYKRGVTFFGIFLLQNGEKIFFYWK